MYIIGCQEIWPQIVLRCALLQSCVSIGIRIRFRQLGCIGGTFSEGVPVRLTEMYLNMQGIMEKGEIMTRKKSEIAGNEKKKIGEETRKKRKISAAGRNNKPAVTKKDKDKFDNLGTKVRQLRIRKKMTQSEVAEALHVTPGYISNVENDRTAMSLHILIYYARLTGLSLDELIGDVQPDYKPTALYNQLRREIAQLSPEEQEHLLKTIRIWKE